MRYKAKASYKKLDNDKNFIAHGDYQKHNTLMVGAWVDIDDPPKKLLEHLTKEQKQSKGDNE